MHHRNEGSYLGSYCLLSIIKHLEWMFSPVAFCAHPSVYFLWFPFPSTSIDLRFSLPWDNLHLYAMFPTEVTAPYPHPSFSSNLVIGCQCTRLTAYRTSRLCRTCQSHGIRGEQTARS